MDRSAIYREHARYCAERLARTPDPARRARLRRERDDWFELVEEPRAFAAASGEKPQQQP